MERLREFVVRLPVADDCEDARAASDLADHIAYATDLPGARVEVRTLHGEDWFTSRLAGSTI